MLIRRQTFRLYPNKAQTAALFEARRLHAYLYNACIAHRKTEYEHFGRSVSYFEQQNCLPAFKECWHASSADGTALRSLAPEYKQLNSLALQATVKRVDLAYNSFFQGLRKPPKFKSIRDYSGWTYSAKSGWKANTEGVHGTVTLNDLGITLRMRGKAFIVGYSDNSNDCLQTPYQSMGGFIHRGDSYARSQRGFSIQPGV